MNAPCKVNGVDCPDRTVEPNCHATCKRYLEFDEERKKIRADRKAEIGAVWATEHKQKAYRKKLNQYKREH